LQWLVLTNSSNTAVFQIESASESNPNLYALSAKTSKLTLSSSFAVSAGSPGATLDSALQSFTDDTRTTTAYVSSDLLTPATLPITHWTGPTTFSLAPGMIVPVQGISIAVVGGQAIAPHQPVGVSGKRVRLQVSSGDLAVFAPANSSRYLSVADNQIFLANAFPPTLDPAGVPSWSVTTLSGVSGTLSIGADNLQLLPADKNDPVVTEAGLVNVVSVAGDITNLTLASALSGIYDATTVTLNANAVESTHGETVQEILGSGDATNQALQFTLKQSPLTYITAATGNGTQSTLQVWANNLQWHEVSNLLAAGSADRVFVSRVSPQASRTVQFGNGIEGARTPTGQLNIRAVYRKGIGSAGMVNANQISQPLDRPQGVKAVTNPSPASGAADPASADDARASAPLHTLTIGRIVSLEDSQNFALNFAGIAKALATWTWFGARRGVFLTVAGANGAILRGDDPVVLKLVAAIRSGGNPFIPLQVASFVPVLFEVGASVKIDTYNYDPGQVLAQVWSNLQADFAFGQRQLAQNVGASQIIELVQNTPGVIAAQLFALNPSGDPASVPPPAMLCASGPMPPQGAQMLLLDPASQGTIGVWS
ncbi:MAG: putative baseplate assembly protein, partial [Acidobacteria bacterium]|nr:putative baseplate assembly protein [Acidobacteriota bacterium]